MAVLLVSVGIAVAIALKRGGSSSNLATAKLAWVPLLIAGVAIQLATRLVAPESLRGAGTIYLILLSNLAVAGFLLLNRHQPGMLIAMAGQMLNVIVIAANGAMPVSPTAGEIARAPLIQDSSVKHEVLGDDTVFPWLGDVIPIPRLGEVISVGDIVLAFGIAWFVYVRMMRVDERRPGHRARDRNA